MSLCLSRLVHEQHLVILAATSEKPLVNRVCRLVLLNQLSHSFLMVRVKALLLNVLIPDVVDLPLIREKPRVNSEVTTWR